MAASLRSIGHEVTIVRMEHFLNFSHIPSPKGIRELEILTVLSEEEQKTGEASYQSMAFESLSNTTISSTQSG